jgi:hypothetical protein
VRRRLLFIGKILAVAIVLFVAVGLFATRPNTEPFKFLEGHKPIFPPTTLDRPIEGVFFSWKGDFEAVAKAARAELKSRGYREITPPAFADVRAEFVIGDWGAFLKKPSKETHDKLQLVYLQKDQRVDEKATAVYEPGSGWVSVQIEGKPSEGIIERLAEWLGL